MPWFNSLLIRPGLVMNERPLHDSTHSEPAGINGEGSLLVPESSLRTAFDPRGVAGRFGAGGVVMASRVRIDRLLVERGLFESRARAQAAIAAGRVTADDVMVERSSAASASMSAPRPEASPTCCSHAARGGSMP